MVCAIALAIGVKLGFFFLFAYKTQKDAPLPKNQPFDIVQKGEEKGDGRKRILVTGGCGFLGSHIVRQLKDRVGNKASLVVLDAAVHDKFGPLVPGVTYIKGDITTYTHVHSALANCDCVVHTAALVGDSTTPRSTFARVNEQGTKNIVEAALERDVRNMVYTSSASVVFSLANVRPGVTGGGSLAPILETEPARPEAELNGAYAKSKAAAERLVLAASSHALRVVVLRPGGVYGMADSGMTPQILAGQPWVGPGKVRVPFVWVEDAARAHVLAAEQLLWPQLGPDGSPAKRIHGRAYHITHDPVREPLLYHEFGGGVPTAIEDLAALGIADRSHPDVVKAEEQAGVHTTRNCAALRAARVSAYGCVANSSVPFPVVWFLARLNFWLGQRFGFVLVDARSTPENMIYASNHWPCDVRDARAVLGWEPTPFRVVAAALGEAGADADPKAAKRYKSLTVGGAEEKKTK
ncbi:hypothetical protein CHLRE_10g442200v5 [Chlamydomonas reinhardtii]|uniref:Ketoreductase domain-containing protein n=1 Tax=Chlamydomonas reinhardtii TaxID=3055 RepID=A8II92_CHLRE|nr:uncharacterized protein CHLRE_10g442200v5 [Chlamydomonas reinhardtii]PNW77565.1 hypothetical protein CHLRE_10g442200v5 [Chlamydomonas reinhardtii]|eukprot:XP_001690522.1 C-3 sterol dehydrogenase/C-4 decarboxylase [Chlamydomonas reinhardtii]